MSGDTAHRPSAAELDGMTPDGLATLAAELDGVHVVANAPKFPVPGTRAEKRAERAVAAWFLVSGLSAAAFLAAFLFWPHEYVPPSARGYQMYELYTPIIGSTFGLAVLALGVGVVAYVKKFFPDEVSVQVRHDGSSDDVDRRTVVAQLTSAGKGTTIARRPLIFRTLGLAGGVFGLGIGALALGGLVRNPWKGGAQAALWVTPWAPKNGEKVYLRRDTGASSEEIVKEKLEVRVRPEDLDASSMETVFPFRRSDLDDPKKLDKALTASDAPVMLIRLRPGTVVTQRAGREDFHFGDYYAYSKVCTHLGCPTSLFESQTYRILCPCHQSQFLATEYAKPVFGPATRSLPQLPITVDEEGYFVARGDFNEAVGPGFWERKS
ncbi:MAG: Rieske (2Fe-2S) protein [Actinomycetota bacterium]|nr:Rieske (2Fe-2S) protein [Actinomycetota bacterium]